MKVIVAKFDSIYHLSYGTFGKVYAARHVTTGRTYAIKKVSVSTHFKASPPVASVYPDPLRSFIKLLLTGP